MANTRTIKAKNYDEFRDMVPNSGLFEMTDCEIEVWCPEHSETEEISRIVHLIESMVHVMDVRVGSTIENLTSDDYRVVITEVSDGPISRFKKER
jgi:hypothetical protein